MVDDGSEPARGRSADLSGLLPLALLFSFLLITPSLAYSDDASRAGAVFFLRGGDYPTPDENKYSMIQPALAVPFHVVTQGVGFGLERSFNLIAWTWVVAWAGVVWWLVRRERDGAYATKVVLLCLVSLTAAYVVGFNGDVFTLAVTSGGVLLAYLGHRAPTRAAGWVLAAIGAANSPATIVALGVIALTAVVQRRRLRYLGAPVAAGVMVVGEATIAEGSFRTSKYTADEERGTIEALPWGEVVGFNWPWWSGLLGILFSFGRGLIFFLPLWVAGFPRRREPADDRAPDPLHQVERALWYGVIALVPVYVTWWAWYGGITFGPRFFLIGTVATALAAVRLLTEPDRSAARKAVVLVAIALSTWIAIAGVTHGVTETVLGACLADTGVCIYTPEFSGLWSPIWIDEGFSRRWLPFIVLAIVGAVYVAWDAAVDVYRAARRRLSADVRGLRSSEWRL